MTLYTRNSAIVSALQGIVDLADVGAAANALLNIYGGDIPVDNDAALGGAVLITSHDMDAGSAFQNATDADPGASSTANPIASAIAQNVSTETATFFRILDRDGVSLYQGNVGAKSGSTESAYIAEVSNQGSGYSVDNLLTLVGGTSSEDATFRVTSVGGSGEVLAVRVSNTGIYTATPSNPVSTSGGGGTGCTLDVTFLNQYELVLPTTTIDPNVEIEINSVVATLPEQSI